MSTGQPSSNITQCGLCIRIYRLARDALNKGLVKNSMALTAGHLVELAAASLGIASGVLQGFGTLIARSVLNHIRDKGFSDPPRSACRSMGFCP